MEKPPHPVQVDLNARGIDYAHAAKLCRQLGWRPAPSAGYLYNICAGINEPGTEFALFLAEKLCEGRVSFWDVKNYPYTRARKRRVGKVA